MFSMVFAKPEDYAAYSRFDSHISRAEFERKALEKRVYLLRDGLEPIGALRYGMFWDEIPFLNLIFLAENERGKGYGRAAMEYWEQEMRVRGFDMALTSAQADESAQHFYRSLGYRDCGALFLDLPGHKQPAELFLEKAL